MQVEQIFPKIEGADIYNRFTRQIRGAEKWVVAMINSTFEIFKVYLFSHLLIFVKFVLWEKQILYMEIIKLEGGDLRLYYLVGHLVMNEAVLAYNLNYPYKTSSEYHWFVALNEKSNTLGFIPVRLREGKAVINNYYVADDDSVVFSALLKEVTHWLLIDYEIESVTQIRHVPDFERCGFSVVLLWKRYAKMRVFKNEEKRV
jgi:hypothetical protein